MARIKTTQRSNKKTTPVLLGTTAITGLRSVAVLATGILGLTTHVAHAQVAANALPSGASIAAGNGAATFVYDATNPRLDINQTSNNVIIDWNTFNVGTDANAANSGGVFFNQNSATSVAVNRVHDVNPSQILGDLTANGQVVILNQNGVFFGSSAVVDVAGLVASTGTIDAGAFNADGSINLSDINTGGSVINDGLISIKDGGLAAFVAPHLVNNGIINATLGKVALAAGDVATVDLFGDGLVELALSDRIEGAMIENNGTIQANGGTVAMTTAAASGVVDSVVNMGGIIEATSFGVENGKIILGGRNTNINITGTINASSNKGDVSVTGKEIVVDGANIDAKTRIVGQGVDADILFKGANTFFNLVAISRDDLLVDEGSSITTQRNVFLKAFNAKNDGNAVLQIEGLIDTTAGGVNGDVRLEALNYFIEIDPTGTILTNGGDFTATSNHGFDIDPSGVVNLGSGNAFIDAPTVQLGDDINTTGTISGTASVVQVENDGAQIQDGVDVAASGATVNVAAGNFVEEISINKDLSLLGSGKGVTNIISPDLLTNEFVTSQPNKPIILVENADNVFIDGVTVDGAGKGNDNYRFIGIAYVNAGGEISNSQVINITDTPFSGRQHGNAIYAYADDGNDHVLNTTDNMISNFQKNAITYVGEGLSGTISGNMIEGMGATAVTAQNGIQMSYGATGVISGNTISDISYTGANWSASDILIFDAGSGVQVLDNTIFGTGADVGISVVSSEDVDIRRNTIDGAGYGVYIEGAEGTYADLYAGWGVLGGSQNAFVKKNTISNTTWGGIGVDGASGAKIVKNIVNNTGDDAVWLLNADNAKIRENYIGFTDNGLTSAGTNNIEGDGIYVESSDGVVIKKNTITETHSTSNTSGSGIHLVNNNNVTVGSSLETANTITNAGWDGIRAVRGDTINIGYNTVTNSQRAGIYMERATNSSITGNIVDGTNQFRGISVQRGNMISVANNTVLNTKLDGIISDRTQNLSVTGNIVDHTGSDGININNSEGVAVLGNYVGTNGGDENIDGNGIKVANSDNARILENTINNAVNNGIAVEESAGSRIRRNTLQFIGNDGIAVEGEYDIRITDNIIKDVNGNGIDVYDVGGYGDQELRIRRNKIRRIGGNGIYVEDVEGSVDIGTNKIRKTGEDGIQLYDFDSAYVINNNIKNTGDDGIEAVSGGYIRLARNTLDRIGYFGDSEGNFLGADGIFVADVGANSFASMTYVSSDRDSYEETPSRYYGVEIVNNNTISNVYDDGIQVLFSGDTLIRNNTITNVGVNPSFLGGDAIQVIGFGDSFFGGGEMLSQTRSPYPMGSFVRIANNRIDTAHDDGIEVIGINESRIINNIVKDAGDDGITVTGFGGYPVPESTDDLIYFDDIKSEVPRYIFAPQFNTVIKGNKVRRSGSDGIEVSGLDNARIIGNTKINRSGDNGIFVSGPRNGTVIIAGNELNNNPVGMRFESGRITLDRDANVINGGAIGLQFDPFVNQIEEYDDEIIETTFRSASLSPFIGGPISDLELVNNSFGTTEFNGQSDFYIRLEDGALFNPGTPTILDATQVSFDGTVTGGGFIDPVTFNDIDGMLYDYTDADNRGLIFFGLPIGTDFSDILPDEFVGSLVNNPNAFLTILGLPFTTSLSPQALANIATQAGGEESPEDLNDLETAAGGEEVGCWSQAFNSLGSGATAVSYNISTDPLSQITDANGCDL